ncbi:hypothetical protein ES319_D10G268400v1 [Gossypium barbadense]|uniref:Uncharacterized protein n=1 Tax=Gossypium barbadense TaxID=3634 RepID=A0A5J5PXS2_GOSBA|nr:hypothetical protein ES319_D10G268400v1 [Gossypium barbadense]
MKVKSDIVLHIIPPTHSQSWNSQSARNYTRKISLASFLTNLQTCPSHNSYTPRLAICQKLQSEGPNCVLMNQIDC